MLIKELSKTSRIVARDLLGTPVGLACYVADCLKAGLSIRQAIKMAGTHKISPISTHEVLHNKPLLKRMERQRHRITTLEDVLNIC